MKQLTVLNLGAGVQSTTLYLWMARGDYPAADYAIFADTGEEPQAVYRHLAWLKTIAGPPILTGSVGSRLGDDLIGGRNSTGGRFASIPAFTAPDGATKKTGMLRRQCTREYKIEVIERVLRRQILLLRPYQRFPKDIHVDVVYGISADEVGRATRIRERVAKETGSRTPIFPLIERGVTRKDCIAWLEQQGNVPHEVPRSACVFCPYHTDAEWAAIKAVPEDWERAVAIDEALRNPCRANRGLDQKIYLHSSVVPLAQVELKPSRPQLGIALLECEGMCGL